MTQQEIRQTVDDVNAAHQGPALLITLAGARYDGRMHPLTGADLILFTDPVTKTTLALRETEVTIANVWRRLQAKRAEYRAAMNEARPCHIPGCGPHTPAPFPYNGEAR